MVPYAAGGTTDLAARDLALHAGKSLGQWVNALNRPGAHRARGSEQVRSPAETEKFAREQFEFYSGLAKALASVRRVEGVQPETAIFRRGASGSLTRSPM